MLNELAEISRSLGEHGIEPESWHFWIQGLPEKQPSVIVELDEFAKPIRVAKMDPETTAGILNIRRDNHNSFPAFNLKCPLMIAPVGVDVAVITLSDISALIRQPPEYVQKDLESELRKFPIESIKPLLQDSADLVLCSTMRLLRALSERKGSSQGFVESLVKAMESSASRGEFPASLLAEILFKRPSKSEEKSWNLTVFLDLSDFAECSHRVADPAVAAAWSKAMLSSQGQQASAGSVRCALSGKLEDGIGDKMPNPNLRLLGPSYLMSMNKDIPCETRYGLTSTDIFPIGKSTVQALYNALRHVTARDRKNKTWAAVPNGSRSKPDLLIAYLEKNPGADIPTAELLSDPDEMEVDGDEDGIRIDPRLRYEARASKVVDAIRGLTGNVYSDDHLRVFVLSTIDKGRKQVLFDSRYAVDSILAAHERWLSGARNVPEVKTFLPQGKGIKALEKSRYVPSPVDVLKSFKQQWIRGGEKCKKSVPGVDLRHVYALFLDQRTAKSAAGMLERYLPLVLPLLIGAGRPPVKNGKSVGALSAGADLDTGDRYDLLTAIATFGILLQAVGRTKERYMEERDYLMGQFLQFADRLHLFYCEGVRGGKVPPQLIGNACISMAMQSPRRAFDVLAERMPVYCAYATQQAAKPDSENEEHQRKIKRARWIRKRLGEVSNSLKEGGIEQANGPARKAEVLLGYLATPPKKEATLAGSVQQSEKQENDTDDPTQGENA